MTLLSSSVEAKTTWEIKNLSELLGMLTKEFSRNCVWLRGYEVGKKLTSARQAGQLLPADGA